MPLNPEEGNEKKYYMKREDKIFYGKSLFRGWGMVILFATFVINGCVDKRHPAKIYMPDMAYSRAFEAYAPNHLKTEGINYIPSPVPGTIKRGDLFPYTVPNDTNGYNMSVNIKNPLPLLDSVGLYEAQRLFNINCAICHGANLDAQGPLATSGKVGGIANLKLAQYIQKPIGQMFHAVTYGKGNMGSYASQLDKKQRWMVVQYVKSEQAKDAASKSDSSTAKTTDTTVKK